ncbi:hypothetical protein LI82_02845 [Methanococcoides methylutens]|uniref:Uncharacterized protein n=1 Tax=Methanococcoides methylutens TaxID=2226 RepID=A0A099T1H3_METMT|nr:hypothetical protein [Methanococcoides methylutens]KGK98992.1 hypothetical protein LI82_02845 [Methanococcoides methylutens]
MYEVSSKKLIIISISLILIFSLISALVTLPAEPYHSTNEFRFSELFNTSFHKFPVPLSSYSVSSGYIDSVIDSTSIHIDPQNVIGLSHFGAANIILIESGGNITEIIADDRANVLEINTLAMKSLGSREFSATGKLMESTVIELYELEIPLPDPDNSSSLTVSALKISHESWEDQIGCKGDKNKDVHIEGLFFIDSSDNVLVTGNSDVLTNCILLSVTENKDHSQSGKIFGEFYNSVKWKSKGMFISSESGRELHIVVDKFITIKTWVAEDSWISLNPF